MTELGKHGVRAPGGLRHPWTSLRNPRRGNWREKEDRESRVRDATRKPGPQEQVWAAEATPPCTRKFSTPGLAARIEYSLGNWGTGRTLLAVAGQHRPWVERAQGCG